MNLGLGLALPTFPLRGGIDQFIRSMFAGGEQGAWYDPSDLSTVLGIPSSFQPLTPASSSGSVIAVLLDKRLALAYGPDLNTATMPAQVFRDGVTNTLVTLCTVTAGKVYRFAYTKSSEFAGFATLRVSGSSSNLIGSYQSVAASPSSYEFYLVALATGSLQIAGDAPGCDQTFDSVTVREVAGNHAYQATSTARPILRDVAGVRYLEFDGVDDYLRATFTIAQPIDRISAIRSVTWTDSDYIYDGGAANYGVLYQRTATPDIKLYSGALLTMSPQLALATNGVVTERHSGATSRVALNNAAYVTGDAGTSLGGGITIGANSTGGQWGNIFLHQLIMRGGPTAMTDAQVSACRALCAIKGGVAL